ncbi:MAG: M23 family metallopeptidase [Desulfobacteraceae bacterium]|nr:M23 family metallopeptidase [Desulfobacteraceae bacterium]
MDIIRLYLEKIAEINNLDIAKPDKGTGKWIFHHGMLFLSPDAWWQNRNGSQPDKRRTLHEGVDILLFQGMSKQIQKLNTDTLVPSATNGEVINICEDFIGKSIIVRHNISFQQTLDLIFVYAHILPNSSLKIGTTLKQGDIIASIAKTDKKKTALPPHLHLSVIEIPKQIPAAHLNWDYFSDKTSRINLINPLTV